MSKFRVQDVLSFSSRNAVVDEFRSFFAVFCSKDAFSTIEQSTIILILPNNATIMKQQRCKDDEDSTNSTKTQSKNNFRLGVSSGGRFVAMQSQTTCFMGGMSLSVCRAAANKFEVAAEDTSRTSSSEVSS